MISIPKSAFTAHYWVCPSYREQWLSEKGGDLGHSVDLPDLQWRRRTRGTFWSGAFTHRYARGPWRPALCIHTHLNTKSICCVADTKSYCGHKWSWIKRVYALHLGYMKEKRYLTMRYSSIDVCRQQSDRCWERESLLNLDSKHCTTQFVMFLFVPVWIVYSCPAWS